MTDSEAINEIRKVVATYTIDTEHWSDYFMELIVDILNCLDRRDE